MTSENITIPEAREQWEEVRDQQSGKLLFKIDRKRGLIQTRLSFWDETRRKRVSSLIVTDLVPLFNGNSQ